MAMIRKIAALIGCLLPVQLLAQPVAIENLRIWSAPDHIRLVFDTTAPVSHSLFSLKNPSRLVIDIENVTFDGNLPRLGVDNPVIERLRSATRDKKDLRVVLDLKAEVKPKSFVLKPNRQYGHRLVVDLEDIAFSDTGETDTPQPVKSVAEGNRDIVIAVDAGHGGEDPGAKGRGGTYEKTVVLEIARRLERLIKQEKGMQPVMIRDGDYYLGLRKRMGLARSHRADLFVSIHADAFRNSRARGSSVYTLSQRGASSEAARWLAERENSSDLVGGVKLEDKTDLVATVLLDLSQTATRQASHEVADQVLKRLSTLGKTHKSSVQQAAFMVLKSPDVPSILVETAFISNPGEERRLKDPRHQQKIAEAIMAGIRAYFSSHPLPGTLLAKTAPRKHVIARGDTLGGIAQQYQVSLSSLRSANKLSNDRILVGQVLHIPET
ncbi:MAG: N-acetylmuramoyl-L-alanine amidase [Gammaproteobacteria bacterium]|nr:N-acetylmuramoyl-L-alanine amidase [Gammaproteobacteria bacterium]